MLFFHNRCCNFFLDLQYILASCVSSVAQGGNLVCSSYSRWWFPKQKILYVTQRTSGTFTYWSHLIYFHQNESCAFLLMYHISLKKQEIVFTHLTWMLDMFTKGVCKTMISTCCGAFLHRHIMIIVNSRESFNTCQKSPLITSNLSDGSFPCA